MTSRPHLPLTLLAALILPACSVDDDLRDDPCAADECGATAPDAAAGPPPQDAAPPPLDGAPPALDAAPPLDAGAPIDISGEVLFDDHFEAGNLDGWNCSGNCPAVTTSPVAEGAYAADFVLTRDHATPYRTELVLANGLRFAFGEEYWLVLRYRYEDWPTDSSAEIAPFQIHTTPSTWDDPACGTGSAYSTAPFLMVAVADRAKLITFGGNVLWDAPLVQQEWMTIQVHFRISSGSDGFVEAWHDGVPIGRVDGRNNAGVDGCGQPQRPPYFKMGVYKWDWKDGRPATDSTRRQLLIDGTTIYGDAP